METVYQLLATDLDGTLLTKEKTIGRRTASAIQRALNDGKQIVFCSGRGLNEITMHADRFTGLRYIISANGAFVFDWREKKQIAGRAVDHEAVCRIAEYAAETDFFFHSYTDTWSISEERGLKQLDTYYATQYARVIHATTRPVKNAMQYCADHPEIPLYKINLFHRSHEDRMKTKALFEAWHLPLSIALCDESNLEITVKGATKGWGLTQLCQYLEVPLEQSIYVGDSWNDIPGMEAAGLSIAMGNAKEEVKALCTAVTADNDHDGVGLAIEKYLL